MFCSAGGTQDGLVPELMLVPSCPVTVYRTIRFGKRNLKPGRIEFSTASECNDPKNPCKNVLMFFMLIREGKFLKIGLSQLRQLTCSVNSEKSSRCTLVTKFSKPEFFLLLVRYHSLYELPHEKTCLWGF